MKINSLKCNHCGADLEIKPKIRFFNCSFCGSSLEVKTEGNAVYTEVLDQIKSNTEELLDHSEIILVEKEIARLDRDWEREIEKYKMRGKHGNSYVPNSGSSIFAGIIAILFAVFWIGIASKMRHAPSVFPLFGFLLIIIAGAIMISGVSKADGYQKAKEQYDEQRNALLQKLETLKRNG